MEENKRFVRLGIFALVSAFVFAGALFLLGGRDFFQPTFTFETYFNNSIAGLELGAPVRFRGVPLGQVTQILTSTATYERDVPIDKRHEYIIVRVKVNMSAREAAQMREDAVTLAAKGLRAQTQLAGITGEQYLSLDFMDPKKYPPLQFPWTPRYTYLPSAPSTAGEIVANVQSFLASLNEADAKQLGLNLNKLVNDADSKLADLPVADLSRRALDVLANANHALREADSLSGRLDSLVADPSLRQTLENVAAISGGLRAVTDGGDLDKMIRGINEAADHASALLGDNQYDVRVIVQDLRVTADNLRTLSETVKRYPAGMLVGGPPDKIQLPGSAK